MKIYSVSHKCYFAFGALVSEEVSNKIKDLPKVRWVLPDSYMDEKNKDYGGEPFINGKAVPYDPKYHEQWIRNNARGGRTYSRVAGARKNANAAGRNKCIDRPRNWDRSRNFERNRENVTRIQDTGYRGPPPNQGMGGALHPPSMNENYQLPPPPDMDGGWSGNYQQNGGYQQQGQGGGMQQQPYPPNRDQYHG